MAESTQYAELARQLSAVGAVKRELARIAPASCPAGSIAALMVIDQHGDIRIGQLAESLVVDMSVTSRHVAHLADRGLIERSCDPADKRSRILRLTPAGHEVLDDMQRRTTALVAERLSDWTEGEIGDLTRLMARLRASFSEHRPSAIANV
ncbi:MarR family winged helix-turn-helix transcriptional regulator [Streptomyces sp. NPDC059477]|uniref:MarR family winged helix-turn-helix transcriptional regulator n=1 Tax=Streptomyces sp. NPDC059477 TaxID=3346847 RepID=UPI0036A52C79